MPQPKPSPLPIIVAAGPKDAEEQLLRFVEEHLTGDLADLRRPIRIVVPSRSLRRHVLRALARRFGALVGVTVQTQRAMALEVLERAGVEVPPGGARLQDVLSRTYASGAPVLSSELGEYDDGAALVAAAVRDLLDACFTAGHREAAAEAVRAAQAGLEVKERAEAVLGIAAHCERFIRRQSWAHGGTVQTLAAEAVVAEAALPSRAIAIYGFAETTGLLADLLGELVRVLGAVVIVDHPPDPAKPGERDPGWSFSSRLVDRLFGPGSADRLEWPVGTRLSGEVSLFNAPGPEAEVREIAGRVRHLHESGAPWEGIGVVFRRLDSCTVAAVRRHFTRLGIPVSGEGATAPGGALARRANALAEVLASGPETRTGAWIGASAWNDPLEEQEIDLALRASGAARLTEVAQLISSGSEISLPTVDRLQEIDGRIVRHPKKLAAKTLREAIKRAGTLVELLAQRPDSAPVGELLDWIREVIDLLGWPPGGEPDPIRNTIDGLQRELPHDLEVGWSIFAPLVLHALESVGTVPMGGDGGGVQVLSVMEARGRTFDHLFLAGLNRGVFPASPVDDPVFSSTVRHAVAGVLSDLPLKSRDSFEERYLFAQLMAASPETTLSWQRVDAGGREMNPSVFLERLRIAATVSWQRDGKDEAGVAAPDVFGCREPGAVRPSLEHAVVGGLEGRSAVFDEALTVMAGQRSQHLGAVLDEVDPSTPRSDLSPWLGAIGMRAPASVWVTRLEQVGDCPWQAFLERELGIEPPPEAAFAEEGVSGRVAGQVVHGVLETIATSQGVEARQDLEAARQRAEVRVTWPMASELESLVEAHAERAARRDGVPALAPAIVAFAGRLLARAREQAWPGGEATILGVETFGSCRLPWKAREGDERELELKFRADRVEPGVDDEGLVLVDYKTGTVSDLKAKNAVPRGQLLQGAAYVLAGGEGTTGRYISFKDPAKLKHGPIVDVGHEVAETMKPAARVILESWDEGVLFPRLSKVDGSGEGEACRWCRVKAACLLGEPGIRRRLLDALESMAEDSPLRQMWRLPAPPKKGAGR